MIAWLLAFVATCAIELAVVRVLGPPHPRRVHVAFAAQLATHPFVWLDWMPRGAPRMPTKPWMLVVVGLVAVLTAALIDPMWARGTYLALATFHIYLELVVLGARLARRYA